MFWVEAFARNGSAEKKKPVGAKAMPWVAACS